MGAQQLLLHGTDAVFTHANAGLRAGICAFTGFERAPLWGLQMEEYPTSRHLYEYCIVYIIFFTQMTVLTRCQENNIGSQRFYQLL